MKPSGRGLPPPRGSRRNAVSGGPEPERKTDSGLYPAARFGSGTAEKALLFHRRFPEYKETPLVSLPNLARELEAGSIYIKDESHRFGLNAFKCWEEAAASLDILRSVWEKIRKIFPVSAW